MIAALGLLTVFGRGRPPASRDVVWFGPVGLMVGALCGLVWWGAANVWGSLLTAALVVAADLAITGLLHLDGLVDSADGLLPPLDRDRRLAVMAAPDAGAFGVGAAVTVMLVRVAAIAEVEPHRWHAAVLLAGLWAGSRTLMGVAVLTQPAARPGGLAAGLRGASPWPALAVGGVLAVAACALGRGWRGIVALVIGGLAGTAVLALARRRIGGTTGDVLGAAGLLVETVALVVVAASP